MKTASTWTMTILSTIAISLSSFTAPAPLFGSWFELNNPYRTYNNLVLTEGYLDASNFAAYYPMDQNYAAIICGESVDQMFVCALRVDNYSASNPMALDDADLQNTYGFFAPWDAEGIDLIYRAD